VWTADLGHRPPGNAHQGLAGDPFVARGRSAAPVAAGGRVYVARPDAHQVVALDLQTGQVQWRFTADGRVTHPPRFIADCGLFGTRSGSVFCLRADDGAPWCGGFVRLLSDERIVAYGQNRIPWRLPGSVL